MQTVTPIDPQSLSPAGAEAYKRMSEKATKSGRDVIARWLPETSTAFAVLQVVNTFSVAGSPKFGFAKLPANTQMELFQFARGDAQPDPLPNTLNTTFKTTRDLTTLVKTRAVGPKVKVIDAISLSQVAYHLQYDNAVNAGLPRFALATGNLDIADPTVQAVLAKNVGAGVGPSALSVLYDPSSTVSPPELSSPANLEDPFWSAMRPMLIGQYGWDRELTNFIGTSETIPEGSAKSYLKAVGVPDNSNRYLLVGGAAWNEEGEAGSEFNMTLSTERDIIIPITAPDFGLQGTTFMPTAIVVELRMRLHGPEFGLRSNS